MKPKLFEQKATKGTKALTTSVVLRAFVPFVSFCSKLNPVFLGLVLFVPFVPPLSAAPMEKQVTHAAYGHVLTNINVWSPDSRWIVYDLRTSDTFDGTRIERVKVETGEVQKLYETKNGAACGVVTYSPKEEKVVFIHGPENPTKEWSYGFTHRRGAIVDANHPGVARPLDAENYAPPFAAGALRGGSHVHVFSPDGQWVSFTYEDDVLYSLGIGEGHDTNQRNVGVSVPGRPVRVALSHPRNNDGDYFSVLVTRTVNQPTPGSDEINRAFEEGWIGVHGYARPDGSRQLRALAFQGNVVDRNGQAHAEVFVVDLPGNLMLPGDSPLGGTATRRPAPPRDVKQRRVTFTSERKFPGVVQAPRHWLRASPDGSQIAFLMKDDAGVVQLWTVSPNGGEPLQVTRNSWDIASAFTWSPDGRWIAHVADGSVFATEVATGRGERLTPKLPAADAPQALACVFSPDGRHIAYTRVMPSGSPAAPFAQVFVVDAPIK
jgi:hypothetical protein